MEGEGLLEELRLRLWGPKGICILSYQVKGRSNASDSIYLRDIRIRIFGRAILSRCVRTFARSSVSGCSSCVGVRIVVGAGSRKVRALVLYDLLKYIVQDGFGVVRILHVLGDAKDVTALADVVLNVFVVALVRELGQLNPEREEKSEISKVGKETYFSEANCSSRSKRSREGGGRSLMQGRNTAAYSCGMGVSN